MTTQHKDIPNAQLHEPKNISTAINKSVYIANGGGGGEWRVMSEQEFTYTDKTQNRFGWNDISDALYTSGSPLSIASGVRTQLTNNGAAAQTDTSRLGVIWNTATNLFLINDLNALYEVRIAAKVKAVAAAAAYVLHTELEGATGPLVFAANTSIIKSGSIVNYVTTTIPFYIGSSINNTNIKVYVTPDTAITMYDIGFVIRRAYKET